MPTGWRPADVAERIPVASADHKAFEKYTSNPSSTLKIWTWVQFLIMQAFLWHLLYKIAALPEKQLFIYSAFLFLVIYSYSSLMDKDPNALWMEIIKSMVALVIIYMTGEWFLLDTIIPNGTLIVACYQIVSVLVLSLIHI